MVPGRGGCVRGEAEHATCIAGFWSRKGRVFASPFPRFFCGQRGGMHWQSLRPGGEVRDTIILI